MLTVLSSVLGHAYRLDRRALALLRVALGTLLIANLLILAPDLEALFSDQGVLPRVVARHWFHHKTYLSLYFITGEPLGIKLLWGLHLVVACAFTLGWKTRVMTPLLWYLTISLQSRHELTVVGFDEYARLLLFWGIFLPWGQYYSLDAWQNGLRPPATNTTAVKLEPGLRAWPWPDMALILQISMIYLVSGFTKTGPEWRQDGSALRLIFNFDLVATDLARSLAATDALLPWLQRASYATVWLEIGGGLAIASPWPRLRLVAVLLLGMLHFGILLTVNVGLFAPICLAALFVFLPRGCLNALDRMIGRLLTANKVKAAKLLPKRRRRVFLSARHAFLAIMIGYVAIWNVTTVAGHRLGLPRAFFFPGYWLRLDQSWLTFSPSPPKDDGWFDGGGLTRSGRRVNAFLPGEQPVTERKPAVVRQQFPHVHWLEYLYSLYVGRQQELRQSLLDYFCQRWRREFPDDPLTEAWLDFYREPPLSVQLTAAGPAAEAPQRLVLGQQTCRGP